MDLALAVLLLWGLLFIPLGIVLHWLVLGEGARVRALPLAPITGVALAFALLATLARLGIDAGDRWVAPAFVAAAIVSVIVIWRCRVEWRSRELIGAGLLVLLAVTLVQMPVVGNDGDGPLGYGTTADPVAEVAAIDVAAGGPAASLEVSRATRRTADERSVGFEQFAALTVAIASPDEAGAAEDVSWTAYGLHATITGMLAVLITLPLFAFARARGVKWLGLIVLVPLGVLAPAVFIALANGEGAAISSVAFTTAAAFSLLVTRRDRGWWALVVLYGAAIAASAGPLALLPLVSIGIAWMFLRSDTYEHLSQHDTPAPPIRTLVVTGVAAGLGGIAVVPILASGGEMLAWTRLHATLGEAFVSWPFSWLDADLSVAGPEGPLELAIWLIGPALLAVAAIYAVVRNERRELGVLVGAVGALLIATLVGFIERGAGIRLLEFSILSVSPFLAALAVRAVALARENAEDVRGTPQGRFAGVGPTALVIAFVLLSFAATTVTGTRMVHAPSVAVAEAAGTARSTLIAAGDPWLEFVVDGERVRGGYADADAVSDERNRYSRAGTRTRGYDRLLVSSSPLSSDPSLRYVEQPDLDEYQVRTFVDLLSDNPPSVDLDVDSARLAQRARTQTADRPGAERDASGDAASDIGAAAASSGPPSFVLAQVHTPVEGDRVNTPADRPAGLLLPPRDVKGCGPNRDILVSSTCEPASPERGPDCSTKDVTASRSPIDRDRRGRRAAATARPQVLSIETDSLLPERPTMLGVQCFDVPLASDSGVLLVHLRDIGHILGPEDAKPVGADGSWETEVEAERTGGRRGVNGGVRRSSSQLGAGLQFGDGRLGGTNYDLVLEGAFGAGVDLTSGLAAAVDAAGADELPPTTLGTLRGSADGFSKIVRAVPLSGVVTVNNSAGTDIEIGRLFARPRDLPRSCDVPVALASGEQREVRLDVQSNTGGEPKVRPGLTVTVLGITGKGAKRVARIAVATYMSRSGLPRYTLIDWTEQHESDLEVEGCDGTTYREAGASPSTGQVVLTSAAIGKALADGQ